MIEDEGAAAQARARWGPSLPIWALGLRDLAALAAAVTLVLADERARASGSVGGWALALAAATGISTTLSAFHVHEWGHYLAAVLSGARPRPARSLLAVFLFDLEERECTRRQWLWMSAGGYLASIVAFSVILRVVDLSAMSGRVTMVLTGLGLLATFAIEIPITVRVWRRRD
jgi:hypothetical protein